LAAAEGLAMSPANLARLGKTFGPELAAWAIAQGDLRRRAQAKFSLAAEMIFVREALEQATAEPVANFHAAQFPTGETVCDLTAGIGADTIALAGRGPVRAYELDPERADCARWNLAVYNREADVHTEDCFTAAPWGPFIFVDPARRTGGVRSTTGSDFAPDPAKIIDFAHGAELGLIKLSPMQRDEELGRYGPRVEFVSHRRECKEALVSFGLQAEPGTFAVRVESGERIRQGETYAEPTLSPGEYLFDVDAAVVRAHALGSLLTAQRRPLGDAAGYLTGEFAESPWWRAYRVVDFLKPDRKIVQSELRRRGAFIEEVKQRGAGVDADILRKSFHPEGDHALSLVIIEQSKRRRYLLAERLP